MVADHLHYYCMVVVLLLLMVMAVVAVVAHYRRYQWFPGLLAEEDHCRCRYQGGCDTTDVTEPC